jgi:acyl-CoA thioester hydrolase
MARVKIVIPDNKIGSFVIPVRISDVNYGNHVGNDSFISILHEARVQWLDQYNYTELNIDGIGLIMSDLEIEFKKESFYGDIIEVELSIGKISRVGFELYYLLNTKRYEEPVILAIAKTGMICYNYLNKKVTTIPDVLINLLGQK